MNRPLRADVLEVTSFLAALFCAAGPAPDAARRVTDALVEAISRAAVAVRRGFSMRRDGPLRAHGGGRRVPALTMCNAELIMAARSGWSAPIPLRSASRAERSTRRLQHGDNDGNIGAIRQKLTAEQRCPDNWALSRRRSQRPFGHAPSNWAFRRRRQWRPENGQAEKI